MRWWLMPMCNFISACYSHCLRQSRTYRIIDRLLPPKRHIGVVEFMLARGAPQHFVLRKQAIARQVEASIAGGAKQLVVIGAGFDALALGSAKRHAGVTCFEIDMPAMHTHKNGHCRKSFTVRCRQIFMASRRIYRSSRCIRCCFAAFGVRCGKTYHVFIGEELLM